MAPLRCNVPSPTYQLTARTARKMLFPPESLCHNAVRKMSTKTSPSSRDTSSSAPTHGWAATGASTRLPLTLDVTLLSASTRVTSCHLALRAHVARCRATRCPRASPTILARLSRRSRYVKIRADGLVTFFTSEESLSPRESLQLGPTHVVELDTEGGQAGYFPFRIDSEKGKTLAMLRTQSREERSEWIAAIKDAVGNHVLMERASKVRTVARARMCVSGGGRRAWRDHVVCECSCGPLLQQGRIDTPLIPRVDDHHVQDATIRATKEEEAAAEAADPHDVSWTSSHSTSHSSCNGHNGGHRNGRCGAPTRSADAHLTLPPYSRSHGVPGRSSLPSSLPPVNNG